MSLVGVDVLAKSTDISKRKSQVNIILLLLIFSSFTTATTQFILLDVTAVRDVTTISQWALEFDFKMKKDEYVPYLHLPQHFSF